MLSFAPIIVSASEDIEIFTHHGDGIAWVLFFDPDKR